MPGYRIRDITEAEWLAEKAADDYETTGPPPRVPERDCDDDDRPGIDPRIFGWRDRPDQDVRIGWRDQ